MQKKAKLMIEFIGIVILGLVVPHMLSNYTQGLIVNALIFSIVVLGLQLIMGYTGQISLGQAAFMGVGAYSSVLMTKAGLMFWLALPIAGILAGLAGFAMSSVVKLKGHYFAMATLSFNIIASTIFANSSITNGTKGILDIPNPKIGPIILDTAGEFLLLSLVILWLQWKLFKNLSSSGFGRTLKAIRDNETATIAAGVNTGVYKMMVILVGCFMAGVAGAIMGHFKGIVSPEPFTMTGSISLTLMIIIGGLGSLRGAIVGAFVLIFASEYIAAYAGQNRMLFYGIIMVVFILFLPKGLDGLLAIINRKVNLFLSKFEFLKFFTKNENNKNS